MQRVTNSSAWHTREMRHPLVSFPILCYELLTQHTSILSRIKHFSRVSLGASVSREMALPVVGIVDDDESVRESISSR
jgi:hypothetical protein